MECAGCKTIIADRLFLTCLYCGDKYDLICANVSEKRFYNTMTADHKRKWQCQACKCKAPKQDNTNTPVRICVEKQDENNITLRRKVSSAQDKHSMISFDLSVDDQIQNDISIMSETVSLPKHSPDLTNTMNYKQLCEQLFEKLESNKHSIIQEIKTTVQQEITDAISKFKYEFTKRTDTLTAENKEMQYNITKMNDKITHLETQLKELQSMSLQAGAYDNTQTSNIHTENNTYDNSKKIVLHGLEEYSEETEDSVHDRVVQIFYNILNVNLVGYIEVLKRIGRNRDHRPLEIELLSKKMAKYILQNRQYFRNSKFTVTEYLDKNEIKKRKELIKVLRVERKKGNYAVIRNNRLYVNGREYTNNENGTNKSQAVYSTQIKNNTQETTFSQKEQHKRQEIIHNEICTKVHDVPLPINKPQVHKDFFRELQYADPKHAKP